MHFSIKKFFLFIMKIIFWETKKNVRGLQKQIILLKLFGREGEFIIHSTVNCVRTFVKDILQ